MISKSYSAKVKRYEGDVLMQLIRNLCLTTVPSYRPIGVIYEGPNITALTFEMKSGFGVELQTLTYESIGTPDSDQYAEKVLEVGGEVRVKDLQDDGTSSDSVYAIADEQDRILLRTLSKGESMKIIFRYGVGQFTASENREYIVEKCNNPSGLTAFATNHSPIIGLTHTISEEGIDSEVITIKLTTNGLDPDEIMDFCFKNVELFLSETRQSMLG